jgi:hypothetical protein
MLVRVENEEHGGSHRRAGPHARGRRRVPIVFLPLRYSMNVLQYANASMLRVQCFLNARLIHTLYSISGTGAPPPPPPSRSCLFAWTTSSTRRRTRAALAFIVSCHPQMEAKKSAPRPPSSASGSSRSRSRRARTPSCPPPSRSRR